MSSQGQSESGERSVHDEPPPEAPPAQQKAVKVRETPKEPYTGFGLDPITPLVLITLYVVIMGAILLGKAFQDPTLKGSVQVWDPAYQLADMKFNKMTITLYQDYYTLDSVTNLPVLTSVSSAVAPNFKGNYWELGSVTLPYTVDNAAPYNVTVGFTVDSYSYNATYSIKTQAAGSTFHLVRPLTLIFDARVAFNKSYLSPHAAGTANALVGILDVPIRIYHHLDSRLKKALVNQAYPASLRVGIIVLSIGLFLVIVSAIAVQFGLSFKRQKNSVLQIYKRQQQSGLKLEFVRKFNRENRADFMVNRYPPLMYE